MAELEHEIKRWFETLAERGYFAYMDERECKVSLERFVDAINNALSSKLALGPGGADSNVAFKTQGEHLAVKFDGEVALAIDNNFQITLAKSDISVHNTETGVKFNMSSNKAVLDLVSVVAMGQLLPITNETVKYPRVKKQQEPLKNKGRSSGLC